MIRTPTKRPPTIKMLLVTPDLIDIDFITAPPVSSIAIDVPTLEFDFQSRMNRRYDYPPT